MQPLNNILKTFELVFSSFQDIFIDYSSLRQGLPLGKKYLLCLNPDFILEIIREYMNNTSSKVMMIINGNYDISLHLAY